MSQTSPSAETRLGIIAGAGRFPFLVVDGAKRAGCHVTVVGLRGFADPGLAQKADVFHWSGLARMGRWVRLLRRNRASGVILAGSVKKTDMYGRFRLLRLLPDFTSLRIWFFKIPDKRNDTVLSAVADEFERHGIVMQDCVQYTAENMAPEGVLTRGQPAAAQLKDAEFGWGIAKQMGQLDIGQSIAVKETEVIAVEAIEGTDRMIERAGDLCRQGGWTLVKVAKPNQDMRFDVPTVGADTITTLKQHGARMLVIEAGKTVIVDREEMLAVADSAGIVVVSRGALIQAFYTGEMSVFDSDKGRAAVTLMMAYDVLRSGASWARKAHEAPGPISQTEFLVAALCSCGWMHGAVELIRTQQGKGSLNRELLAGNRAAQEFWDEIFSSHRSARLELIERIRNQNVFHFDPRTASEALRVIRPKSAAYAFFETTDEGKQGGSRYPWAYIALSSGMWHRGCNLDEVEREIATAAAQLDSMFTATGDLLRTLLQSLWRDLGVSDELRET